MIERLFKVREAGPTPGRKVMGGLTTFLTMAYIIFVNPFVLSKGRMPYDGVVVATCLGAALGTFLMGFLANYPIALAPGMGMNRRRTKVSPHFFQEAAAMKLIYATLVAASKKWRGVEMTTAMYAELAALREQSLPKEEWQLKATAWVRHQRLHPGINWQER